MAMRSEVKWIAAGAALLLTAACAPVDPDPVYPEDGAKPGDSGEHGAKATERYRKGQTKPVQIESASGGGAGSGGGSGPR